MDAQKTCMQGVKLNVCLNLYMYNCFCVAVGLKHSYYLFSTSRMACQNLYKKKMFLICVKIIIMTCDFFFKID